MKLFLALQDEWWRAIVFLLWIMALAFLLVDQGYVIFLRPEFGILLALGVLALTGFLISGFFSRQRHPPGMPEIVRGCILTLPLLYMLNAGEQGLGASVFQNRSLGLPRVATSTPPPAAVPPDPAVVPAVEQAAPSAPLVAGAAGKETATIPRQDKAVEVTILDLYMDPDQYQGKLVSVVGMVARNEQVQKDFGEKSLALFRFTINCCAADAMPLALVILDSDLPAFPDDTWVKASGVFGLEEKEQDPVPVLKHAVMEKTKAPKVLYL